MEKLNQTQIDIMNTGHCPDCGHRGFVLGPRGGASINLECGSMDCRSRFNVAQTSLSHRFVMGHRIEKQSEGGWDWQLFLADPHANA